MPQHKQHVDIPSPLSPQAPNPKRAADSEHDPIAWISKKYQHGLALPTHAASAPEHSSCANNAIREEVETVGTRPHVSYRTEQLYSVHLVEIMATIRIVHDA